MEFSRQEYWSGLPFPSPGDLPDSGIEPRQAESLPLSRQGSHDKPRRHIKSRDITLLTKVHLVKPMVCPAVMYGCESRTVKKAERQRIDAFELWCWRRLLRVPCTAKRSNQSILKDISPGISLEGMMLKLKLQYFDYLMQRVNSLEKTLMLGGIAGGGQGDNRG